MVLQSDQFPVFITCPKGLQYILENELKSLGAERTKASPSGVSAELDKLTIYRILMWSRIANRVILELGSKKIEQADDVYDLAASIDWSVHFTQEQTFAVEFIGTNNLINHTSFGGLRVKDAVADQFRERNGVRPSVNKDQPDIRISAHLYRDRLTLGLDLSGESMHRRGYRQQTGLAPLKENLAAGLLILAGWNARFDAAASFLDPMCGSGTLLIEAAMIALQKAPMLDRSHWGFDAWLQHDMRAWSAIKEAAKDKFEQGKQLFKGRIVGFDADAKVVQRAWENIKRAGLESYIHVEKQALESFVLFEKMATGLVLTNPPYGARLGEVEELKALYQLLGQQFERHLLNWQAGIFTGNESLGRSVGWRSYKQYKLLNGAIESQLLLFDLKAENRFKEAWQTPEQKLGDPGFWRIFHAERAQMFHNRLLKNKRTVGKWALKNKIDCYRLYDADMPEFALAIDVYTDHESKAVWFHVQEYAAPKSVDKASSLERLREALAVLVDFGANEFLLKPEHIVLKRREMQKGTKQYERQNSAGDVFVVKERNASFLVNLKDYLDTGLFLDHRPIRQWVHDHARGKRFLNLFCYTASVTVHAALGGAVSSLSVDMSNTYLAWAKDNFELNRMDLSRHKLQQQDCLEWLKQASAGSMRSGQEKYDLIFLDPPSFSNSKRMQGVLDIQRDHVELIEQAMSLLAPDGQLVFSNNLRKFRLDEGLSTSYKIKNVTQNSIDKDFERHADIHQCWLLQKL
jgi:23S rRNA (guanine2445-N2)-methyltransferase / 23S rRNA (guanine2069-N7)-methyltransferase